MLTLQTLETRQQTVPRPQVLQAEGLQTIFALLPASEPPSGDAASAAPATLASATASTPAAPSWAGKPASHRLQAALLHLLAALLQSQQARTAILQADSDSSVNSTSCCAALLNILDPDAPPAPVAPPAAAVPQAGAKGGSGKPDGKAKAVGKGKADTLPSVPTGPPAELLPPFPTPMRLAAAQCLQVRCLSVLIFWIWTDSFS